MRSEQYIEEWEEYRRILREFGLNRPGFLYEVKGNHDAFNVLSSQSKHNYFASYSNVGTPSYSFARSFPFGNYSFVAVDAWYLPSLFWSALFCLFFSQQHELKIAQIPEPPGPSISLESWIPRTWTS